MFRVSCAIVVIFSVVVFAGGLPTANADLAQKSSADFTYQYEMGSIPGAPGFVATTPERMSAVGGVLTLDAPIPPTVSVFLESSGAGSTWYDNTSGWGPSGYTVEIRAKVISTTPGYPGDLTTSIGVWTAPRGQYQNGLLQIAGSGTLWGGRDFEPVALNSSNNMDAFHVFRVAQLPNPSGSVSFSVWRDGTLIGSDLAMSEYRVSDWLRIGAYQGIHQGVTDIDYIRYASGAWAPVVPEPATLTLLVTGMIGLLAYAWRKRR